MQDAYKAVNNKFKLILSGVFSDLQGFPLSVSGASYFPQCQIII